MGIEEWLCVAGGGALGAVCRLWLTERCAGRMGRFPLGTFTVNVTGSFLLGAAAGVCPTSAQPFVIAGFCGALTTFSTFALETFRLALNRYGGLALLNAAGSLVCCVAATAAGAWVCGGMR
ncbi:MAG TPA: CrcB family protein [Candidatus Avidesulfovibrio excrementigallinarum]|nr:CrcB family protein [Candidatus Avidesulfovibrio excrementigallinarum]